MTSQVSGSVNFSAVTVNDWIHAFEVLMKRPTMAKRRIETASAKTRTEFQLYVNWKGTTKYENVLDFTELKLMSLAARTKDMNLKSKLKEILLNYQESKIAVAWQGGEPAWTSVTKDG